MWWEHIPHNSFYSSKNVNGYLTITWAPKTTCSEKEQKLQSYINELKDQIREIDALLTPNLRNEKEFEGQRNKTISKLHDYNDIKDIAQLLIGKIAELDGMRVVDVYKHFGLDSND